MFRPFLLAAATISLCWVAYCSTADAQQPPPPDARIETYKQLLSEANDRVVSLSGVVTELQAEVGRLKADLEKAKPADKPAAPPEKKAP